MQYHDSKDTQIYVCKDQSRGRRENLLRIHEQCIHFTIAKSNRHWVVNFRQMENGVVYLYHGGEQDDEIIEVSNQAEADRIAMEHGAEHWDYVER